MADHLISDQKKKLEQKKARIQQQETLLKIKERKARVRHLIEVGGLMAKAKIDHLPSDILLGACLSFAESIKNDPKSLQVWKEKGAAVFEQETQNKTPLLLKLDQKPEQTIRNLIRAQGLKWNALRQEWYGYANNLEKLKTDLKGISFKLDIIKQ